MSSTKNITDEECIAFGMIPELVGRISTKITTNQLTDAEYMEIIRNSHSRVSVIVDTFKDLGVDLQNLISDEEILELIKLSKSNKTGVRWALSQIEGKMLESIRETGVDMTKYTTKNAPIPVDEWLNKHQNDIDKSERGAGKDDEFFF